MVGWFVLIAGCKPDPSPHVPGIEPPDTTPPPSWPERPTTVASSTSFLSATSSGDGTVVAWVEGREQVDGVDVGPLSVLDLATGESIVIADRAMADEISIAVDGSVVAFTQPGGAPTERALAVAVVGASAADVEDLGPAWSNAVRAIEAAGTQMLFYSDAGHLRWQRGEGAHPLPVGTRFVPTPDGVVAWCDSYGPIVEVYAGKGISYPGVPCNAAIAPSGAIAWSDNDGVWAAWPDTPDAPHPVLPSDAYVDALEYVWSDDGSTLALRAEGADGVRHVLWTWTWGDEWAARVGEGVDGGSTTFEAGAWLFTRSSRDGTALHRAIRGETTLLHPDVCAWTHGSGRIAWSAGDCAGGVEAWTLYAGADQPSAPFAARVGSLSVGPDGMMVVDGLPGEPGTAWVVDGPNDPEPIADDLDNVYATAWGWVGSRGALTGDAVSFVGPGWQTAPGDLHGAWFGRWHLVSVVERGGRFEIEVALLAGGH